MLRALSSDSDPPLSATRDLAVLGAGSRWLSADLAAAESRLAREDAQDAAHILSYGGLAWIQAGDPEKGVAWLARGIDLAQRKMAPDDPPDRIDYSLLDQRWRTPIVVEVAQRLAFAYRLTGHTREGEDAMDFLEQHRALVTLPTDPRTLEALALTGVLSGDIGAAREYLRLALELGWANYYGIVSDAAWAETLQVPEFQSLLSKAKANNDRQRSLVEAADTERNFRAEFERLLSAESATD